MTCTRRHVDTLRFNPVLDPLNSNGFWLDGDSDCQDDVLAPCCSNYQICDISLPIQVVLNVQVSESEGLACAAQDQGICLTVETATDTGSAASSGNFGFTVTTTANKVTYFTVGNFAAGQTKKVCDCRASNTFGINETVASVDAASISNQDGWKIKDLTMSVNGQVSSWLLDVNNANGFWLDGNDDCGEPCCPNYQVCQLGQE